MYSKCGRNTALPQHQMRNAGARVRGFAAAKWIDLRSDTVTQPSKGMRIAMSKAPVGDDVYREDPTVNKLQRHVASLLGKEAGLFCPSGTMANLIAMGTHSSRGDEVILGKRSHIFWYEGGGLSAHMGVAMHTVDNDSRGCMDLRKIREAIRPLNDHYPRTSCVALESTHNLCGGAVVPLDYCWAAKTLCDEFTLPLHLDGARLWNSARASRMSVKQLAEPFDSVSVCLSKGLGAPVGSVLVGTKKFIASAKRLRKALGGGMRQAGLLAAAGLYALENGHIERLDLDHRRAKLLAAFLSQLGEHEGVGFFDDIVQPETNIIYFSVKDGKARDFCTQLKKKGVLMNSYGDSRVRCVLHLDVDDKAVEKTMAAIEDVCREGL